MSLKKATRRHHGTMTELNITPLLDLVFVLLVIFIITTPQMMNNLEINLPSGKPPVQKPKAEPTRIEINGQGQITLNQSLVTAAQLKEKLTELKAADPDLGVVVKGADDADYQSMVSVLDILRQLDITKLGMATE
jgi:biopolymer transport protein ExbD